VEETTGYVDAWGEGFQIGPESAIAFHFTIWSGMMVQQVDELMLDLQGSSYGNTSHPPTVSLWDWESDDWEILNIDWGQHSIPKADAYVLSSGDLRLRLETELGAGVESLKITIKGQR
jgi:hypothetical protein